MAKNKLSYKYILYVDSDNGNIKIDKIYENPSGIKKLEFIKRKLEKKKLTYQELKTFGNKEKEKKLLKAKSKKIKESDVDALLELIVSGLASGVTLSALKSYIEENKEDTEIHPLIVLLVTEYGLRLLDILELFHFSFKEEILSILRHEEDSTDNMYNKLSQVILFKMSLENLRKKITALIMKLFGYSTVAIGMVFAIKFKILPLVILKLGGMIQGVEDLVKTPQQLTNIILYIFSGVGVVMILLVILYLVSKKHFNLLMMKVPVIKDIYMYGNTLKGLILYTFYATNTQELFPKLNELIIYPSFGKNEKISKETTVEGIYKGIYKYFRDKYGVKIFYPIGIMGLGELVAAEESKRQKVIDQKVKTYLENINEAEEKISGVLNVIIIIVIAVVIMILFMSIFSIGLGGMSKMKL